MVAILCQPHWVNHHDDDSFQVIITFSSLSGELLREQQHQDKICSMTKNYQSPSTPPEEEFWVPFQYKDHVFRYRDSHYKDKEVMWPSL